jgi:hypothetical protein
MRPFAGSSSSAFCRLVAAGLLMATGLTAVASDTREAQGGVPQPVIERARGDNCVESPAFMRRNHMRLLKHQRDDTLRGGIRTTKYSLKACISCHASQKTGSVATASTNFCQSCHAYAAVRIDCFECHSTKPASTAAHPSLPQERSSQSAATPGLLGMAMPNQVKP